MRPVFFKLTLWNDPQEWDVCPIFRDACRAANRDFRVNRDRSLSLVRLPLSVVAEVPASRSR